MRSCVICDPSTGSTDLGFTQPVSVDLLRSVEVLPLSRPVAEGHTRIRIADKVGSIVNQCMDGRVYVKFDDTVTEELYDLSKTNYQWVV